MSNNKKMRKILIFEKFYHPPIQIKQKLETIVNDLLKKHEGGRKFFDALDDSLKDVYNEDLILALLRGSEGNWIATSGDFGDRVFNLWKEKKFKCNGVIVFNGKIATQNLDVERYYPNIDISKKSFIYVDDSYFSGKTANKINNFLHIKNSYIKSIHVIYDGSKIESKMVKSFFRYYKN